LEATASAAFAASTVCRYAPAALAKSGEATSANGCPFATCWPCVTSTFVTAPENGARMSVAWLRSKSTTPVVVIVVWYCVEATVTTWMLLCCCLLRVTLRGVVDDFGCAGFPEQPASLNANDMVATTTARPCSRRQRTPLPSSFRTPCIGDPESMLLSLQSSRGSTRAIHGARPSGRLRR